MSRATPFATALLAGAALLIPGHGAQAAGYDCDASALRASVLGAAAVEPLVANRGAGSCHSVTRTVTSLPADLPLLGATVGVAVTSLAGDTPARQQAVAVGGLAGASVKTLPELPVTLPPVQIPAALGAVTVPLPQPLPLALVPLLGLNASSITVDVRPAVEALLPDGRLPSVEVLSVAVANAYAVAGCSGGRAQLTGGSQLSGVKVLGQDISLGAVVEQAVSVLDSSSIDMSTLDVSRVVLPAGLSLANPLLAPILTGAIRPVLDALPDLSVPGAVAKVRLTPGEQTRTGNRLTQRALRAEVSLLGQTLVDAVIGEATVAEDSVDCAVAAPSTPDTTEQILSCSARRLVLTDVVPDGRRVRLEGVADKALAGKTVDIVFRATERVVARARVQRDGSFEASAPMPARSLRATNEARYRAEIGGEESLDLKLMRRMMVTSMRAAGGKVTIIGRLTRPLARPLAKVVVKRRVSCSRSEKVAEVRPDRQGRFEVVVDAPDGAAAAVYRLESRVQRTERNRKAFPTYTLPRGVNLR